jgi:Fic-DOC domain mobile mystery protein B
MDLRYPFGATPLDPNELQALIPKYITTQAELDEAEQENISKGELWANKQKKPDLLTEKFIKRLHKEMFGKVWRWAGTFRQSDKNIGVDWPKISTELYQLLKDTEFWIQNKTYEWDEIGARFHHRLVTIHCFANGNGRHSRAMTDLIMKFNGQKPFTWGARAISKGQMIFDVREKYISALKSADQKDIRPLMEFVKS